MKKGIVILIIFTSILIISLVYFFYSKDNEIVEINCSITPEGIEVVRVPLINLIAKGKQTGAEEYTFLDKKTVSLCCANVNTLPVGGREFKDCIHFDEIGREDYKVVWEKIEGKFVKIKEMVPSNGLLCTYNFDESGEWSGRFCEEPKGGAVKPHEIDESICPEFNEFSDKMGCIIDLAIEKNDYKFCDNSQGLTLPLKYSGNHVLNCYTDYAGNKRDQSICELSEIKNYVIKNQSIIGDDDLPIRGDLKGRDACYLKIVQYNFNKNDFSLEDIEENCNKLEDPNMQRGCLVYKTLKR